MTVKWFNAFSWRPGRRAATLMMMSARGGAVGKIARALLVSLHASDVSPGAVIVGPPNLPHAVGIVIGSGAHVEEGVTIYHGVTLGQDGKHRYPTVRAGAVLYANATIVGAVEIGAGAIVGACTFVMGDVAPGEVLRRRPDRAPRESR